MSRAEVAVLTDRPTTSTEMAPAPPGPVGAVALTGRWVGPTLLTLAVGIVAFVLRLRPVLDGGGIRGTNGYDDGVYYSAGAAILAGRVPYRDFVLLHPPTLPYLLVPFAALGRVIGDANGFAVARVAFMLMGAVCAMLAMWVGCRFGRTAGVACGLVYAVWGPAVQVERTTLLEIPANVALLIGLLLLGRRRPSSPTVLAAGFALGVFACFKIWGVAPLLLLVAWPLLTRSWRRSALLATGAAAAGVVILGPTLLAAPRAMVEMVLAAQVNRPRLSSLGDRLGLWSSMQVVLAGSGRSTQLLAAAVIAGLAAVAAAVVLATPGARVFVALLGVNLTVLLLSPTSFQHYNEFLTVPVALVLGVGLGRAIDLGRGRAVPWRRIALVGPAGLALAVVVGAQLSGDWRLREGIAFPAAAVRPLLDGQDCVAADEPTALILTDRLTDELDAGCPVRIDVTGVTYTSERMTGPGGVATPRRSNSLWQNDIRSYLLSQPVAILARHPGDSLSPATLLALHIADKKMLDVDGVLVLHLRPTPLKHPISLVP